jgi:hypothetical protein
MKTINSLSGGKSSSYIAVNYPADYNIFSLIRTNLESCLFPDSKVRQIVSDKIGSEFIGTLEDDMIIYTMLDLEQYIGKEIIWLSPITFEDLIEQKKGKNGYYLPNQMARFCTVEMKIKPIAQWCYENTQLPIEMRIGFRGNEKNRVDRMNSRLVNQVEDFKFKIGRENNRNKFKTLPYRFLKFPLYQDKLDNYNIHQYWKDKPIRFAYKNNCVGCFHRSELFLNHISKRNEKQFNWFIEMEKKTGQTFKKGITYEKIKNYQTQISMFDDDFNDCDSGYCGL